MSGILVTTLESPVGSGQEACLSCGETMQVAFVLPGYTVRRCGSCDFYRLRPENPSEPDEGSSLDRHYVLPGLRALREKNYARVLEVLRPWQGGRLLDVGCSTGLFLACAQAVKFTCYGMEPDAYFRREAERVAPGRVVGGSFPGGVPPEWRNFDVITFHDVLEHLSDPIGVLWEARRLLAPGGVIGVSLPVADGFAFRFGCGLGRVGITFALQRLFQVGFPYPHWFYFSRRSLVRVAVRAGLEIERILPLEGFSWQGIGGRARLHLVEPLKPKQWLRLFAEFMGLLVLAGLQPWVSADQVFVLLRVPGSK